MISFPYGPIGQYIITSSNDVSNVFQSNASQSNTSQSFHSTDPTASHTSTDPSYSIASRNAVIQCLPSPDRQLLLCLTPTSILIWSTTRPIIQLSKIIRTHQSIQSYGTNVNAIWYTNTSTSNSNTTNNTTTTNNNNNPIGNSTSVDGDENTRQFAISTSNGQLLLGWLRRRPMNDCILDLSGCTDSNCGANWLFGQENLVGLMSSNDFG